MIIKKIISIFISVVIMILLTACQNKTSVENRAETATRNFTVEAAIEPETYTSTSEQFKERTETSIVSETTLPSLSDPAEWTVSEIAEAYRNSAKITAPYVKSEQYITLKDISINNGEFEGVLDFVTPIMSKLLSNNSTEIEGITGGYERLSENDIKTAKAYSVGDKIAIEMIIKDQTDGAHSDANAGSVGHAVSAVGDINNVAVQLKDLGLPIEISEKDTKIHYTNTVVKVLIDSNGKIANGSWGYIVEIMLNNYKVAGSTVETTSVILDNSITLNGGF